MVHDFTDETLYWSHPILDFAAPEDLGAMDVLGSQVGPGTFAKVLILNPDLLVGDITKSLAPNGVPSQMRS